jgi:AcrR family transcriptional regulator
MQQKTAPVKRRRPYDASGRRRKASETRARVVEVAERLFLRDGYRATTVAAIASEAGVSPDSIYKSFGGKPGLVRAVRARALHGGGRVPAEERSDALHDAGLTGAEIIAEWGQFTAEVAPRAAPLLLLVRAAADDPDVAALADELDADRLRRMTENARRLHAGGHLRPGVSVAQAADVLWTYSSPELYELLVLRRGWSPKRFGRFVADAMTATLL